MRVTKDNENLGILPLQKALDIAWQEDLDLVEIVPNAKPPVCSIMDFNKWKFDEKKKVKEQKQKVVQPKEIRLRPVSSEHDILHKVNQLKEFLIEKRAVNVNMRFKSREASLVKKQGFDLINRIVKSVEDFGKVEQQPKFEGSSLFVRIIPK